MGDAIPYIGSRISLISKAEIRYEGTLYSISMEESSIALQNVRSFGTEGRRLDGPQVPPQNEVYEIIIFKGEDIKDLTVMSAPAPQPPSDPAIISASGPVQQQNYGYSAPAQQPPPPRQPQSPWGQPNAAPAQQNYTPLYGNSQWGPPAGQQAKPAPAPTVSVAPAQRAAPPPAPAPPPKPANYAQAAGARPAAPGRGAGFAQAAGRGAAAAGPGRGAGGRGPMPSHAGRGSGVPLGPPGQPRPAAPGSVPSGPAIPKEEFDFNAMLEKFKKEELTKEASKEVPKEPVYKKDDFFDLLSCEALERSQAQQGAEGAPRGDWRQKHAEQKKIDMETFGGLGGVRHHSYGRGRGGGHRGGHMAGNGRPQSGQHQQGGRGGGRDGGRGGYGGGGRGGPPGGRGGRGGRGN